MTKLEDLQPNAAVRGILPDALVTVVNVQWFGSEALELMCKTPAGKVANELLYRHNESPLGVIELGWSWRFDGKGAFFGQRVCGGFRNRGIESGAIRQQMRYVFRTCGVANGD